MGDLEALDNELELLDMAMNVFEETSGGVGTDFEEQMENLVNPYRKFVRTEIVGVKSAPFSSSTEEQARAYFFKDLILIALPSGDGTPESIGSMLEHEDAGKRNTLKRFKNKYNVFRWLDLHRCNVRDAKNDHALQVTYVSREREMKKTGTMRVLTRVEKIELIFESAELAQELFSDLTIWIDELIEIDLRRASLGSMSEGASLLSGVSGRESMVSARTGGTGTTSEDGRKRTWATRKNTRRAGTLRTHGSSGLSRKGSGVSDTVDGGDSIGGLSLADLESRYKLQLDAPVTASVEYVVEFGEGMMGFRLSSGPSVGVIVGKIADGSFSDEVGICIGDRVLEVDETPIELDTTWQEVVELIKSHPRPLRIKFERFAGRHVLGDEGSDSKSTVSAAASAVAKRLSGTRGKKEARRAWAAKRAQRAHAADVDDGNEHMISLKEVEKLYRAGKASEMKETQQRILQLFAEMKATDSDEAYQQACRVLEEIWSTERSYVQDLRMLVREFILPLRRKTKRLKCREQNGSRICEHNMLRSQCSRTSATAENVISSEDMRTIFLNVETLVKINTELLAHMQRELVKFVEAGTVPTVTDVAGIYSPAFQRVMPFVKLYSLYCHMYPQAIDHLLILRTENPDVDALLKLREERAKTSLNSLLITPVQRLCRYPLLFNELLRHVRALDREELEPIIEELERTAKIVSDVAEKVNDIVGEQEDHETLMDVYNELGGSGVVDWLIAPSRKFITKVEVLMHEAPYNAEPKKLIMYLCTDLIIFGKSGSTGRFGSLKKSGGKLGTPRSMSLRKKVGSLRHNSSHHGSISKKGSLHRSTGHGGGAVVKLLKTIELKSVTATKLGERLSGMPGIELKYVHRSVDAAGKGRSGKQKTSINKMRIWLHTDDEMEATYMDIDGAVNKLKTAKQEHARARSRVGAAKTARSWKSRSKFASDDP
ncbi:Rho guanine nucleotide exchange factor, putative [Hondaea fermentalgiana]|uniref:Rho guanine nucleotide exchange factor, putative n=1 Tax=Hondaea fermentalgiana TaxID=2315210 RepID=A0A2R5GCH2_9STRA|nr:Rho guanine nucleotide exchange factor, putative [Hondaea fermentalgiana]|eukprot:GBG28676.1 Rho guanine nucleotide exchange factor, putative [Hondaea fermentalgiana]